MFPDASRHGIVPFPSGKDNEGASSLPPATPPGAAALHSPVVSVSLGTRWDLSPLVSPLCPLSG